MTAPPSDRTHQTRPLETGDLGAVRALLENARGEATYIGNDLAREAGSKRLVRQALGVFGRRGLSAVCWFGGRSNLLVTVAPGAVVDGTQLAEALQVHGEYWRIALGPPPILAALSAVAPARTRILRTQIFCEVDREREVASMARTMRGAVRGDLAWLVTAAVELNRTDLGLRPDDVSERWLRDAARARLNAGATFVVGPRGAPHAKLDLGSAGPAGVVIEGVFTDPRARGQGVGAGLVAAVCQRELRGGARYVTLHVDRDNAAARACYARAGMREVAESGLLLREA